MRFARAAGRGLAGAVALCVGAACAEGTSPATSASNPKTTTRSDRPDPFDHSAVACRACGAFVEGQTALTFQGSRGLGADRWLHEAAKACVARAKRDGWSLEGDLQVEVSVGEDGAPRHACGAHKAMDPRLATCLLDAFDAMAPREPGRRTFATWLVPKELAPGIPAEEPPPAPSPPIRYEQCDGAAPSPIEPAPSPAGGVKNASSPLVRSCAADRGRVEAADRELASRRERIRGCYEVGLKLDPDIEGRVSFKLDLGEDGAVSRVCWARSGSLTPAVARCITSHLKALRFDPPAGGRATLEGSFSFVDSSKGKTDSPPTGERPKAAAPPASPPPPAWPWPVFAR